MTATLPPPPRGLARAATSAEEKKAAADEQFRADTAARGVQETAQTNHAANIKLERLARREPIVKALLDDHTAAKTTLRLLQEKHTTLEKNYAVAAEETLALRGKHGELSKEFERVAREKADLEVKLAAANERVAGVTAQLGKDLDQARAEAGELRKQLAAAKASPPKK